MRARIALIAVLLVCGACSGSDGADVAATTVPATSLVASAEVDLELNEVIELPAEFPDEIPLPADLELERADVIVGEGSDLIVVTGHIPDDDSVALGESYVEQLEAAGFEETERSDAAGSVFYSYENETWFVSGGFNADAVRKTGSTFGITVAPADLVD